MTRDDKLLIDVATFLSYSLEGELTAEQYQSFSALLRENHQARDYYYRLLALQARLQETESILAFRDVCEAAACSPELWNALSMEEITAPAVEIPPQKQPKEIVQLVPVVKSPRQISKFSLFTLVLSAAAVLFVVLFLHFAPDPRVAVATVTDSLDAVFAESKSYPVGSRLRSHADSIWLKSGVVKIAFDYGAQVVIEGPAEFRLKSAEDMTLLSGRVYAHVPDRSKGFTVETPTSRVIDLGTEFGVSVHSDGACDVHMIKGKASLIPGIKGQTGPGQFLTVGQALHVNAGGEVLKIALRDTEFVRDFLSARKVVWRGQSLDLADIVGGGCGFGTGRIENAINPLTGEMSDWALTPTHSGPDRYVPVPGSAFIDGVFVPNGANGPIQVTSSGLGWYGPATSGMFKYNIVNSLRIPDDPDQYVHPSDVPKEDQILAKAASGEVPLRLMGLMAGPTPPRSEDSSLFIHSNLGITFDLDEIRKAIPNARITGFKSLFGIGEITLPEMNLDLWILTNGQPRMIRRNLDSTASVDIAITLSEADRFLTLVVTEGTPVGGAISGCSYDWGVFMNPRLELE